LYTHRRTRRGSGGRFLGQALIAKILNDKNYFNTGEKLQGNSVFQGKLLKILNDKKYIFNRLKNVRATVFFRASASCSKILNNIKYIFSTVNSGHPLFFRASANCSKLLNVRNIFNTVKIYTATLIFQGKRKFLKNPEW